MQQEEINLETLTGNKDINIGYADSDIVIVDSIQKLAEIGAAHVAMSAIALCTSGRIQGLMNGQPLELRRGQVAVFPPNVVISDLMSSPDLELKAMFFTYSILQSFLREKISVWNEMMYIRKLHILTLEDDEDIEFYTHFYDIFRLSISRGVSSPYSTDITQSLMRAVVLGVCGVMKQQFSTTDDSQSVMMAGTHFRRFLDLLHSSEVKHRTVEYYASQLFITPKYLSAICKKNSGKTANEWIREHVMEDIRYYLTSTDYSVKQISDRLGFPNPSFFGKYVREHFGVTPGQFRRKTKE